MGRQWVKLRTNILEDVRHSTLTMEDHGVYLMLLALSGLRDHRDHAGTPTGALGSLAAISRDTHIDTETLRKHLPHLVAADLIRVDEFTCYYLVD